MVVPLTQPTRPLARELTVFLVAVFVGSLSGLVTSELLVRWAAAASMRAYRQHDGRER
jgi:hypothetical protein